MHFTAPGTLETLVPLIRVSGVLESMSAEGRFFLSEVYFCRENFNGQNVKYQCRDTGVRQLSRFANSIPQAMINGRRRVFTSGRNEYELCFLGKYLLSQLHSAY